MEVRLYTEKKKASEQKEYTITDVEDLIGLVKNGNITIAVSDGKIKAVETSRNYRW